MGSGGRNRHDLTGKKFGRLLVESYSHSTDSGKPWWFCVCECGIRKTVRAGSLRCGFTKSCGCLRVESGRRNVKKALPVAVKNHILPPHEAAFRTLYGRYRTTAQKRGWNWELTQEQCRILFGANCFYCGVAPEHIQEVSESPNREKGVEPFRYTGIDRIDSSLGYLKTNVVPCCTTCNWAKNALSLSSFMIWIDRISEHRNGVLRQMSSRTATEKLGDAL